MQIISFTNWKDLIPHNNSSNRSSCGAEDWLNTIRSTTNEKIINIGDDHLLHYYTILLNSEIKTIQLLLVKKSYKFTFNKAFTYIQI